jgi:hypothetical protein
VNVASDRSAWHHSPPRANCAQEESSRIGSALLLGHWWEAAQRLVEARSGYPSRSAWIAWLGEIPISESHASNLMRLHRAGLATPAFIVRDALALLAG